MSSSKDSFFNNIFVEMFMIAFCIGDGVSIIMQKNAVPVMDIVVGGAFLYLFMHNVKNSKFFSKKS